MSLSKLLNLFPHKKRKSDDFHLCNVVVFFFPANSSVPVRKTALSYTI